jgi:hypothetical protein
MKRRVLATITLIAVLAGSLLVSGFAAAQGTTPAVSNGTYAFYLHNTNLCMVDNGAGHQMTVSTKNCAPIKVTNISGSNGGAFFTVDGHCIWDDAFHKNRVEVTSAGCSTANGNDFWWQTHSSPYRFVGDQNLWLKTDGAVSGYRVWTGTSGGSNNWDLIKE